MEFSQKTRIGITIIAALSIVCAVLLLKSPASYILDSMRGHWYRYAYFPNEDITTVPAAVGAPAEAVPILMYHGVIIKSALGDNTTRDQFIDHMEMLKREGYTTISVDEYYRFREGTYTLPHKPIIITFDDARKDSYYTVDTILEKLGFKATNFVASGKQHEDDTFFLSWDELRKMRDTGRWELEAHGRHSHDKIRIDEAGTIGRYLTSRIYTPGQGLESIGDFEARVKADYADSVADLETELGITPRFYAVPLSDYGEVVTSNYPESVALNKMLTASHFDLAFVQSHSNEEGLFETFYNYRDTDPHTLTRLEAKNMSAEVLRAELERFAPHAPAFAFPVAEGESLSSRVFVQYGELLRDPLRLAITPREGSTAGRVVFGNVGWSQYRVDGVIARGYAREASLIMHYQDDDNLVTADWDENDIGVIEHVGGVAREIARVSFTDNGGEPVTIRGVIQNGTLSVYANEIELVNQAPLRLTRGAPGFGVWDPERHQVSLTVFQVTAIP